jgi:hypothetical protein
VGRSEALRRAQPRILICCFGVRRKLKPFSSVAVFEDQERANPVPEQDDAPSSLIDARILAEYVYLSTLRLPSHAGQTLGVFAVEDHNTVQVLGPSSSAAWPSRPMALSELGAALARWLEVGA